MFWRVPVRYFVGCPHLAFVWCFYHKIVDMSYWEENQNQRGRVLFLSHHIKDTYYLCDWHWRYWPDDLVDIVNICQVLHCKVNPPMPFPDCKLGKKVTMHSIHLRGGELRMEYLYKLFGVILHWRYFPSLMNLFKHLSVWIHRYLF